MVEGERIGASRMNMAASSDVFAKMLMGDFKEAQQTEIVIPDAKAKLFKLIVEFYYTFDNVFTDLDDEELVEMLKLADRFQTDELIKAIQSYLLNDFQFNFDNYVFWGAFVDEFGQTYGFEKLKDKLSEVIRNMIVVKKATGSQSIIDQFYAKICEFSFDKLVSILKDSQFCIDDENFFQYLMNNNKDLLVKLVPEDALRFPLMSQNFLLNDVKAFLDSLKNGSEYERNIREYLIEKSYEALRVITNKNVMKFKRFYKEEWS